MTTIHIDCEGRGHISVNVIKVVLGPGVNSKERPGSVLLACRTVPWFGGRHDLHNEDAIKIDEVPASCSVCLGEKCYAISKTSQQS